MLPRRESVRVAKRNAALMKLARVLVPVNYTKEPRLRYDPACTIPPLPTLAVAAELPSFTDRHRRNCAKVELMRGLNRFVAALAEKNSWQLPSLRVKRNHSRGSGTSGSLLRSALRNKDAIRSLVSRSRCGEGGVGLAQRVQHPVAALPGVTAASPTTRRDAFVAADRGAPASRPDDREAPESPPAPGAYVRAAKANGRAYRVSQARKGNLVWGRTFRTIERFREAVLAVREALAGHLCLRQMKERHPTTAESARQQQ